MFLFTDGFRLAVALQVVLGVVLLMIYWWSLLGVGCGWFDLLLVVI